MFSNLNSRGFCRNWLKFTPDVFRSVWLHVKAVMLSEAARQKYIDDGFGGVRTSKCRHIRRTQICDMAHPNSQQSNPASLQNCTPIDGGVNKLQTVIGHRA